MSEVTDLVTLDYGADAGLGYENQTKADTSLPIINLLQSLSPQCVDGSNRPGEYINSVTGQIWGSEGFLFVPATTRHVFTEWIDRKEGGGYCGQHEPNSPLVLDAIKASQKFGKYRTPDNHQLTETFYVYGVLCSEDGQVETMAVVPFVSTKIRAYKGWMTRLRQTLIKDASGRRISPPLFAHLCRISSTLTKNNQGSFYVPTISSGDPRGVIQSLLSPSDERFQMAKTCRSLVDSGTAKVDYADTETDTSEEAPF